MSKSINLIAILISLCTFVGTSLKVKSQTNRKSDTQKNEYTFSPKIKAVKLNLNKQIDEWKLDIEFQNFDSESVLILTNPIQSNGKSIPYLNFNEKESILDFGLRFYSVPDYLIVDADQAGLLPELLQPKSSWGKVFALKLPMFQSVPPYENLPLQKKIDDNKIKQINISIGILPNDDGIKEIIENRIYSHYLNGREIIQKGKFKGKYVIETQVVLTFNLKLL